MRDTGFGLGVKVTLVGAALLMAAGGAWAADKNSDKSASGSSAGSSDKSKSKSTDQPSSASGDHGGKAGNKSGDHGQKKVAMAGTGATAAPPTELDTNYKSFEGTWKCESRVPAGATGPNSPESTTKGTVKIKKDLNGHWYVGEYEAKKGKTTPEMKGEFFLGYNPQTQQTTMTTFDSTGGMMHATGSGMQGDTLTFTGEGTHGGQKVKVRETMTKKSDKEITNRVEVDSGQGFQQVMEQTCKK